MTVHFGSNDRPLSLDRPLNPFGPSTLDQTLLHHQSLFVTLGFSCVEFFPHYQLSLAMINLVFHFSIGLSNFNGSFQLKQLLSNYSFTFQLRSQLPNFIIPNFIPSQISPTFRSFQLSFLLKSIPFQLLTDQLKVFFPTSRFFSITYLHVTHVTQILCSVYIIYQSST